MWRHWGFSGLARAGFFVTAATCTFSATADAGTIYYTFTGTVTAIENVGVGGLPALAEPVQYTFLAVYNAHGLATQGGTILDLTSSYDDPGNIHYFYDEFLSGSPLIPVVWGPTGNDPFAKNYGVDFTAAYFPPDGGGSLLGSYGNFYNFVQVTSDKAVGLWTLGDSFQGFNYAQNGNLYSDYSSTLTLTSITTVPEPGSLALLGAGLIGARTVARRKGRRPDEHQ
jgi:hypothetical protein